MPVTCDLYGDRSGNTRNVLVEPNRVSWLKRHFARIRYGPRSGTGRIPFCRRAAWYGRCVHPTSTLWRSNCLLGSGSGAPNGLVCYSAKRGSAGQFGTPELLITDLIGIIRSIHPLRDINTTGCRTAEKHPKKTRKDFKKPISLVFCMGQKTHEKTQKFSPGSGTENSIYSFGNEVRDDFFFRPGPN